MFGPVKISKVPALLLFALIISELFCQAARLIPLRFTKRSSNDVGKTIGSTVGVDVGVGVGDGEFEGEGVGVGEDEGVGFGEGFDAGVITFTPLPHTSFLPDLTQVNFMPFAIELAPTFLHESPCLTAADTEAGTANEEININRRAKVLARILKGRSAKRSFSMTKT